ncbi:alternate-type signal peptide domain-containing protein [Nocardioides sp. SOB44]|jgi:alternate signal-mediated exported protein|uniref:Alternate-type signal peptide domain-containing protein n=1 Tax=Nocardioides cremeus TaxID=3058044 RepID=A0ABT8TJV2_9ACTN|nr:alternate-type signal peptide domain-containing protein [Nocardioides cremeus]MDO3394237.1 alternate-type signal peptide domain-containing protein [Nocardioides cremeus]
MRTSPKAALAGVAGAGLLLGGAGSLAFWNDTQTEDGGTIESGTLNLLDRKCSGWLSNPADAKSTVDLFGEFLVVPGTKLTQTCTYGIRVEGVLDAELSVNNDYDDDGSTLGAEIDVDPVFSVVDDAAATTALTTDGTWGFDQTDTGKVLKVVITVELPFGAGVDNDSNSLVGDSRMVAPSEGADPVSTANVPLKTVLDDLTVTVKQTA